MTFLYWLSLALGGGLFLVSLLGEFFDAHGHFHSDKFGVDHGDTLWGKLVSLRTATYFLFAFGAVGVGLSQVWHSERDIVTALAAAATGVIAAVISALIFQYLSQSESGERATDTALVGKVGRITLPLTAGGMGKVEVSRANGSQELLARPLDENEADAESWSSVLIVDVRDGIAYVAPYSEDSSQLQE